jgi:hypothetical protein
LYKYRIQFAHADVRETAGELNDDTPKGWGTTIIDYDRPLDQQSDVNKVTREIALSNLRDDGSPRYTHVSILKDGIELLEHNGVDYDTHADAVLFKSDFEDVYGPGVLLGDDDHFAVWGHDWTDEDIVTAALDLLEKQGVFDDGQLQRSELKIALLERGGQRVRARRVDVGDENELVVSWAVLADADVTTYPITVLDLH